MLSVVTGNPSDHRRRDDHRSAMPTSITFTGSVRVGKYIADKAGYKPHRARARRQRSADRHGGRRPRQGGRARRRRARPRTPASAARRSSASWWSRSVADAFAELRAGEGEEAQGRRPDGPGDRRRHRDPRARRRSCSSAASTMRSQQGREAAARQRPAAARCIPPTVVDHVPPDMRAGARGDVRPGDPDHPLSGRHRRGDPHLELAPPTACRPASAPTGSTTSPASSTSWRSAP